MRLFRLAHLRIEFLTFLAALAVSVLVPLEKSSAAPHPHAGRHGCVTHANGECVARISASRADPCKSGNCGLEYKTRGSGGSSRPVLKMNFGKRRSGRGGFRRGGRSFRGGARRSRRGFRR